MKKTSIKSVINKAESTCKQSGSRLTSKRQQILEQLLRAKKPLSAYNLADMYKERFGKSIPPMSVYRILDFLVQEKLAHKLTSTNQYLACSHIACDHQHEIPQFLICDSCNRVTEIGIKKNIIKALENSVNDTGFLMASPQLELHGQCKLCRK